MTSKQFFIFFVVVSFFIVSCKKEKESTCTKTMAGMAGVYHYTKMEMSTDSVFTDISSSVPVCIFDNKFYLKPDGLAVYQDEGSPCGGGGSGVWSLGTDGSMILVIGTVIHSDAIIISYDCSKIVFLETDESGTSPITYRSTISR
jgi:hypothetical protein